MLDTRPACRCHGEPMNKKGGGKWRCRTKDRAKHQRWASDNREHRNAKQREWAAKRKAAVAAIKGTTCMHCEGEFPPEQLHFHHRDPETKLFVLSDSHCHSWESILAEIAKCDVLCSDCHTDEHRPEGKTNAR